MAVDLTAHRAPEDLTARARIRDAALRLFAERGIAHATIRDIAQAAGVSSGLVRHHFGSKEALRDACDAYAMEQTARLREQTFTEGRLGDQSFMVAMYPSAMLLQSYLVRSLMDGSGTASAMFDEMVRVSEDWLASQKIESHDVRAHAAVIVAMKLGALLLHEPLSRALGVDVRTPEGHARMTGGFLDAFAHPLLDPEQTTQAHAAIDRIQAHPPTSGAQDVAPGEEE